MRAAYGDGPFGQVHYLKSGGSLAPVVFLNPRSRSCLKLVPLLEAERPVLVVDVPAYGASAPPSGATTMEEIATAVGAVLDAEGVAAAHLCGFHTGAKVAAAFAAREPGRTLSLTVCGKSHSLIPDREIRNSAMRGQLASRKPDVVLVGMESYSADDLERQAGPARVYDANFAFDFAGALGRAGCPVAVIEFASDDEDAAHGRQGEALAACARDGRAVALPEREAMGIDLYVGADKVAAHLLALLHAAER